MKELAELLEKLAPHAIATGELVGRFLQVQAIFISGLALSVLTMLGIALVFAFREEARTEDEAGAKSVIIFALGCFSLLVVWLSIPYWLASLDWRWALVHRFL